MFQAITRIGVACALALGVAASAHAQAVQANANAQDKKEKRHPNQVPDTGVGQDAESAAPSGFERNVDALPVSVRADGTIVVELDDSFMEAATATVDATGVVRVGHVTGLDRASAFVRRQVVLSMSGLLPARALPLAYPIYEVK